MAASRVALVLLVPALLGAAQFIGESSYSLPPTETRIGDLYFGGTMLRIEGRLDGSVIAGAQSVNISGPVTRNLFIAAQSVDLTGAAGGDLVAVCATLNVHGRVGGAVRAAAGTVYINGPVGQDVVAGCANLVVTNKAEVLGDLAATTRSLEVAGIIRGDIKATAERVVISGSIDGDVDVIVGDRLTLTPDARVYGNLRYRASKKLDIKNPDLVFGNIEYVPLPAPKDIAEARDLKPRPGIIAAFFLPFAILSVLGALAFGFIIIAIWKYVLNEALTRAINHWGRTLGFGALGFLAGPMSIIVSFALIVTIPTGLVALAAYVVFVYVAKVLAGMFLGKLLFRLFRSPDISLWVAAPVGIVIVYGLCAIPVAGWIIWLVSLAVGFGVMAELLGMSRTA